MLVTHRYPSNIDFRKIHRQSEVNVFRVHRILCLLLLLLLGCLFGGATELFGQESLAAHPDSLQQSDVPSGKLLHGTFNQSQIYPGTEREYWVYVPAQYQPDGSAAIMVFQDGQNYIDRERGFRVPNVLDNLIHRGEIPVTIAIMVTPGVVPAPTADAQPRYNRSFEYDSMDDRYARFLIEELLPRIRTEHELTWSDDPNLRAICGASSGGICAFSVAWHRPDQFRRVYSTIGTYVGLRGGQDFATRIRKTEPKPLRVFLQDGSNDLNIYGGDWWMANQTMLRALQFSGYEVNHAWGEGGHDGKHGAAILPDVMRWLWEGWKERPVAVHWDQAGNEVSRFLREGDSWQLVSEGHEWAEGLAVTDDGTLYFTDVPASKLYKISPDGQQTLLSDDTGNANGIALGPDGKLYGASSGAKQIRRWNLDTLAMEVVTEGTHSNDVVVLPDGTVFYTDPAAGKVWRVDAAGQRSSVDDFAGCNGIGLSADHTQLFVADFANRFIYAYTITPERDLTNKQPFVYMEIPLNQPRGHLDGMCSTEDGWLVATSQAGVQICDQLGRCHLILELPPGSHRPCYVAFGGPERTTLYVANVDKIWKRETKLVGARPWTAPVKPPKPRL